MKSQRSKKQPSFSAAIVPAAAATAALLPPAALAGPGDFDPGFGSVGRLGMILNGPAWALEAEDDGSMILGGGRPAYSFYYWGCCYYNPPSAFVYKVKDDGEIDLGYTAPVFDDVQVRDVARQPDGEVVAVGRRYFDTNQVLDLPFQLAAFRLLADGSLDTSFADEGLFTLSPDDHGERQAATSVVLEPDGRIVIAGNRDDNVIVLRLLPDGSVDDSFGTAGLVVGPINVDYSADDSGARTSILRDENGGYRLTASNAAGCQVFALASDGAIDAAFGVAGLVTAEPTDGTSTHCNAIARQPDGNLLVAGSSAGHGFVNRLLPDGQPDAGWTSDAVSDRMTAATAVAVADDDNVVVGGQNGTDSLLLRLAPDGMPDAAFGKAGSTVIDLEYNQLQYYDPVEFAVHDIHIFGDGAVAAAGGPSSGVYGDGFAVRLFGDAGGDSPGVVGFDSYEYAAPEEGGELVLMLRRSGGSSGAVSAAYRLVGSAWTPATNGVDYELIPGRASWTDGDRGDQEIRIPIFVDATPEGPEVIAVELYDVQGGAGLGSYSTIAVIPADGSPHGQLAFEVATVGGIEGSAATLTVSRNFYTTGAISVTLTPEAGSAEAGLDFDASPTTLSWADGEGGSKVVQIPIVDDTVEENSESFSVRLSDPTGGAILADPSVAVVRINANDRQVKSRKNSGGGAAGLLSLVFLGFVAIGRRLFRT